MQTHSRHASDDEEVTCAFAARSVKAKAFCGASEALRAAVERNEYHRRGAVAHARHNAVRPHISLAELGVRVLVRWVIRSSRKLKGNVSNDSERARDELLARCALEAPLLVVNFDYSNGNDLARLVELSLQALLPLLSLFPRALARRQARQLLL